MKFCQTHWNNLRQAIKARGLWDMVAGSGEEAVQQAKDQLGGKEQTKENFDPLMAAHWTICNNAMDTLKRIGANPLALLTQPPEDHPEWECPLCYLNYLSAEHDRTCMDPNCTKTKGLTFDIWIDKAADGVLEYVKELPEK